MLLRRTNSTSRFDVYHRRVFLSRCFSFETSERDSIAARVHARRPDVANQKLIRDLDTSSGPSFFTRWLGLEDRVFRESSHGRTFTARWMWAKTTDPLYDFRRWHRLQSPYRYVKTFSPSGWAMSDLVRRLVFPDLALVLATSSALSFYNAALSSGNPLCLPPEPFTLCALAVGLLVTFRTKTSYNRYNDACQIWSSIRSCSRELCSRILTHVPTPRSNIDKCSAILKKRDIGAKLAQSFCHAMKYHVTVDGSNADLRHKITVEMEDGAILALKRENFRDELYLIWDFDDDEERAIVDRLLKEDVHSWPLQVCQEIGYLNATQYVSPNAGGLGAPNAEGVNQLVTALQHSISACENIVQTPIYTPYTVFTGRILYAWVHMLPLVFAGLADPLWTPFISVCTAFLFLGIDDMGQRVEQPFTILPLWQHCDLIDRDCNQLMRNARSLL
eukprot:TRINITY_DN11436_c0_g3_i1.p1 TRINITY_DN11436_c0_g3~~TRINITY_DN11436_c0_g3_i1.p1  ORF type:complete len:446 (-),score=20.95 TRINITY_DN11436_c0_g3_i1:162-1499(-)